MITANPRGAYDDVQVPFSIHPLNLGRLRHKKVADSLKVTQPW